MVIHLLRFNERVYQNTINTLTVKIKREKESRKTKSSGGRLGTVQAVTDRGGLCSGKFCV